MENLLKKITGIKSEMPNRWNIPAPTNLRFVNPDGMCEVVMCYKILWQVTIANICTLH